MAAVVSTVVLVAVGVVVAVAVSTRHPEEPATGTSCDLPASAPAGVSAPGDRAPGGGGLRVVEQGFSPLPAGTAPVPGVSLGAVLENTSGQVAYRARIRFRVLDTRGVEIPAAGALLSQQIPVILPGQRIGVGAWTYVGEEASGTPVTAGGFEVRIGATEWLPESERGRFAEISTRHQQIERSPATGGTGTIRYSVESGYCRPLVPRGAGFVFRDSGGAIAGGSFQTGGGVRCRPGSSEEAVSSVMGIPAGIDESRTESHPYCDVAPGGGWPEPGSSEVPVNYR